MIYTLQTGPLSVNTYIVTLSGSSSNCPAFIVDPAAGPYSGDSNLIIDFLRKKSLSPVALVLTHGHFDHVSGLGLIKAAWPQVPVLIHQNDKDFIGSESAKLQTLCLEQIAFDDFAPFVSSLPEPTSFLEDSTYFLEGWQTIHTPGHTPGSVCLYCPKEGLLISGDTIFYQSWGRTDLLLGSESEIQSSLAKIYKSLPPQTKVFPGHGKTGFLLSENF